jgi:hypothetical protein
MVNILFNNSASDWVWWGATRIYLFRVLSMRDFIYRAFLFLVVGLFIVFGYNYTIYRLLLSDISQYVVEDGVTTIVIGDSHTETSIDGELLNRLQNYSYKGESLFLGYYKLKRLLEANSQIENVLLAFSYHSLNEFQDGNIQSLLYAYYWLLDWEGAQQIKPTLDNIHIILRDVGGRLYQWVISIIKQKEYHLLTGRYREMNMDNLDDDTSQKRIIEHYYIEGKKRTQEYSSLQMMYLEKIIQLCVDRDIKLIFINTPLHKSYYSNIPEKYISRYYSLVADIENRHPGLVTHLDFKDAVTADEHFYDGDHLNAEGGIYFMKILNKRLQSLTYK